MKLCSFLPVLRLSEQVILSDPVLSYYAELEFEGDFFQILYFLSILSLSSRVILSDPAVSYLC